MIETISQILKVVIPNAAQRSEESKIVASQPVSDFSLLALPEMTEINCIYEIVL